MLFYPQIEPAFLTTMRLLMVKKSLALVQFDLMTSQVTFNRKTLLLHVISIEIKKTSR